MFVIFIFCEFDWLENKEKNDPPPEKILIILLFEVSVVIFVRMEVLYLWSYARFGIWVYVSKDEGEGELVTFVLHVEGCLV